MLCRASPVVLDLKSTIWSIIDVPPERQKLLGMGKRLPSECVTPRFLKLRLKLCLTSCVASELALSAFSLKPQATITVYVALSVSGLSASAKHGLALQQHRHSSRQRVQIRSSCRTE